MRLLRISAICNPAISMLLCLVVSASSQARQEPIQEDEEHRNGPGRYALIVGIDNYRSSKIRILHGCKNDVKALKSVLVGRYHFPERNVHVLIDSQATYEKLVDEFKSFLIGNSRPGDIVVFHFSGHGSRSPDPKSPSGFAETIVPYDSRDQKNLDITSQALSSLLRELARRTKNVTVILDSCNSGRMVTTRGTQATTEVRSIPAATSPAPPPPFPSQEVRGVDAGKSQFSPFDDSYVLLAAALAKESAQEYPVGDERYGAMSYFLTQELQRANSEATYRDVMDAVQVEVSERVSDQTPQLVGPNQDHALFGTQIKDLSSSFLVVSSTEPKGQVKLPYAGAPHGVTPGSTYDVYNKNTVNFGPPSKPIARVEIIDVKPGSSEAKIVSGGTIPDYSHAVLHELKLGERKLRVTIQKEPRSKALDSIAATLRRLSQIKLTDQPETASLEVSESNGNVLLTTPDGTSLGKALPSTDAAIDREIGQQILKWVNWFSLLSAVNTGSSLDVRLSVAHEGSTTGSRGAGALTQIGKAESTFYEGDPALITITNNSERTLYITVLVLSSDRTISVLLPERAEEGAAVELKPGGSISPRVPPKAFLPPCLAATEDSFKVIATSNPVDLRPLEQSKGVCDDSASRSPEDFNDLMNAPSVITRGFGDDPGEWTTVRKVVEVRRRLN